MGQAILRAAHERNDARIVAALVRSDSELLGRSTDGDLVFAQTLDAAAAPDLLIDFSAAAAFDAALALALSRRIALVSGTTGLSPRQQLAMRDASKTIPVLWSANFSLGVAVLTQLVREAARALPDWDCEIAEVHHRHKKDAPSGTALALGREIADAREVDFDKVAELARSGAQAARRTSAIGFASMRAGDIVGEHTVMFAGDGERIELAHRATDRAIFARGALAAALWLRARAPGLYSMADVVARRR